jgi:hypothetical protein
MSDADERLKALFALDRPPRHDPAFVLEVAHRLHRRRLWLELFGLIPWVIAASAILWVLTPWLQMVSRPAASGLALVTPAAGLAFCAWLLAAPRSPAR